MSDSDNCSQVGVAAIGGGDRLLARLQELESSHRKQQEMLLREQMRQKEMLAEHRERVVGFRLSSPEMQIPLEDRMNPSGSSDPSGSGDDEKRQKRGMNVRVSSRPGNKFDENAAVSGAAVPFQYLVEQKLKEDTGGSKTVPKTQRRKFLKRGEGLKRFGEQFAKPRWISRSPGDQKPPAESEERPRAVTNRRQVEPVRSTAVSEVVPVRKPRVSTESETMEKRDLRAFELLEEAAQDSSFCSSGSVVERFLIRQEKFIRHEKPLLEEDERGSEISSRSVLSSSPLPPPVVLQEEWQSCRTRVMKDLDDYLRTFDWVKGEVPNLEKDVRAAVGFETEDDQTSTFDTPEKPRSVHPHVRFNEMVQKLTFPADGRGEESSINCESETEEESESDFGGRSDEVVAEDEVVEVRRPEVKPKTRVTPRKPQAVGRFRPALFRSRVARGKKQKATSRVKPANKKPPPQAEEPAAKHEDFGLAAKAEQLNREMGIFRRENERVLALRRQLDAERRKLQQAREKLTQETVEQSKAVQKRLREEEDKLKRDRLAFEKFRRDQKYAGDVKLQEEIRLLKLQLQDMEAELKEKDAKFGSAQSRYKMSLRKLENANDDMRAQISKLEAENEKLKRQVVMLKNPKETMAAQKLTRQIHDVNDLISKTFFKNPGTIKKVSNEQPLRGLLKKSSSEPAEVDLNAGKPTRSRSFGVEHEVQLREGSRKAEERLLKETEGDCFDMASKDVGKTKVTKFPRIAAKEVEKTVDFREEPTSADLSSAVSEELREFRPQRHSGDGKDIPVHPTQSSNVSQISQTSETSSTSMLSKSTESSNRFFDSEVVHEDGTIERTLADGRKEIVFPNGNRKVVSPNGKCVKIVYYNGDVQEVFEDGTVEYFFAESRTWHTTKPDRTEIIELPSGEVQTRKPDGEVEVVGADGLKVVQKPNGTKIAWQPNGTRVETKITGERTIYFPNGEQEVQNSDYKKRIYVDGTEKLVYNDGRQETRYSNGRLRIRDSHGNLVVDCFA